MSRRRPLKMRCSFARGLRLTVFVSMISVCLLLCSCVTPFRPFHPFLFITTDSPFVHNDHLYYLISVEKGKRRITGHGFMHERRQYVYEYRAHCLVAYSLAEARVVDARVLSHSAEPHGPFPWAADDIVRAQSLTGYRPAEVRYAESGPQGAHLVYGGGGVYMVRSGEHVFHIQFNSDSFSLITPSLAQYTLVYSRNNIDALHKVVDFQRNRVYLMHCAVPPVAGDNGGSYSWYTLFTWDYKTDQVTKTVVDKREVLDAAERARQDYLVHATPVTTPEDKGAATR